MEHPVKRADLIVCTPGEPFAVGLMAADLYKKKMAKHIFIPETPPSTALMLVNEQGGRYPTSGELLFSILKTLGVPASACILGKQSSETIREEAEEVRKWVLDSGKSDCHPGFSSLEIQAYLVHFRAVLSKMIGWKS